MATGASNCDLAVMLIDARHGVVTQTRRHSFIVSLLGIKHLVVAVNKMDLVGFDESVFRRVQSQFSGFAAKLELRDVTFMPISALHGDNVVDASTAMPWYQGGTLMHFLENVHIASDRNLIDFRLPVQYVNRPQQDFRGYCGTVASGVVRTGDEIIVLPSRHRSRIKTIHTHGGELLEAHASQAISLTLEDELDISRGDVLAHPGNLPCVEDRLEAMLVWMGEEPMTPGKRYTIKHLSRYASCSISHLRYRIDVNNLHRREAALLNLNEIGRCSLELNQPLVYDDYANNRTSGSFVLIDRLTNGTVGAGMIIARRSHESRDEHWKTTTHSKHVHHQPSPVLTMEREMRHGQRAATLLLTGLPGSGKSTIGGALERRLFDLGHNVAMIDGPSMRLGLSRDLGSSREARSEAMRRGTEVARLMNDNGMVVILTYVAPSADVREKARTLIGENRFLTVHLNTPLEICRARDKKGVYQLANTGEIGMLPGSNLPYEAPKTPDLSLDTSENGVAECVAKLVALLESRNFING